MKKIKEFFLPTISDEVKHEIDVMNIKSISVISLIGALMEVIALMLVIFDATTTQNRMISGLSVGIIAIYLFIAYFMTLAARKRKMYNHIVIDVLTTIFFIILLGFSIYISGRHYTLGDQIITFYIMVVCFISFIVIPPIVSIPLILVSFIVFFTFTYFYDGAVTIQGFNFFAFADIAVLASVIKYRITINKIKQGIQAQELNKKLEKLIRYDYLTKIKNRYALIEDSVNYFNKDIVVCMCDIDKFKKINDTYGHIMGDKVIAAVAGALSSNAPNESIYRFGGDEFLIISDYYDEEELLNCKENVKESIKKIKINGLSENIECSFGTVCGVAKNGNDLEELVNKADSKLYEEKKVKYNK